MKALEVLIDAAEPLARRFPGLMVLIVGSGPEADALERRIEQRGLAETVKLIGQRGDIPDVLRALSLAYGVLPCTLKLMAAALLWSLWIRTREDLCA